MHPTSRQALVHFCLTIGHKTNNKPTLRPLAAQLDGVVEIYARYIQSSAFAILLPRTLGQHARSYPHPPKLRSLPHSEAEVPEAGREPNLHTMPESRRALRL